MNKTEQMLAKLGMNVMFTFPVSYFQLSAISSISIAVMRSNTFVIERWVKRFE
jgi:hypothetical protein